jgi:Sec-independent protein translocase protein TatA
MNLAAIFGLGPVEIIIIVAVIILLFLPALLPKIARRAADTFRVVKDMTSKVGEDEEDEKKD